MGAGPQGDNGVSGPCFAPEVYQHGHGDETQYCHVGGAFEVVADVKLALGELTVKLQLTFFPLPDTHKWYGKSIAQRLEACGWRLLEIEVKAVAPSPAASHKRASSSSTTPGTEAEKRSKQAN